MAQRFRHASARSITAVVAAVASISALVPALLITNASATDPDTPTRIVFSTQPGDGDPDSPFVQPVVTLQKPDPNDSTKWVTANSSDTISLSVTPQAADSDGTFDPGTYVGGTLTGCTSTNNAGVVGFSGCTISHDTTTHALGPGKYTLTAHDSTHSLTVDSSAFYISGPTELTFTTPPGGGTAGTAWLGQPVVKLRNAKGELLNTGSNEVGVAIQAGTGTAGAVLSCHNDGTANNVIAFSSGVAGFTDCKIDKPGATYKLYAVDPADRLVSAPTAAFSIASGDFAKLAFTTQPAGAVGGVAMTQQPVVTFEDAGGNTVSTTDSVVLTKESGPSGGSLSCTDTTQAATAGVATFAGCKLDKQGTYTLRATSGSVHTISENVVVNVGPAGQISFTTPPSGAVPGTAFTGQPVVRLTDLGGNPATGSVQLSIKSGTGTSGAVLTCAPVAAVSGDATFSDCKIDKAGDDYTLTATSGSLTADSSAFNVATGTAAALAFTQTPDAGGNDGGSAFPTQPRVKIKDAGGFAVTNGSVDLSIEPGTGTPQASLSCDSTTVAANSSGVAVFSGCRIDKAGHGYRLRATLHGTSGATAIVRTSDPFDIGIGSPAQIVFSQEPTSGTGGVAWDDQPVVTVEDAGGNPVHTATGDVTLGLVSATSTGSLSCQDTTIPVQDARAIFAGCSIDKAGGDYTLTASWSSQQATSDSFGITAGRATGLVFSQQPGGAVTGTAFTRQPTVRFVDAGGNTASSGTGAVSLAIAAGSGASGAALSGCSASTSAGVAAFSGCAIGTKGGGYVLRATSGSGSSALCVDSLPFSVIPSPPATGAAPYVVPLAETFGGNVYGANPTKIVDDVNTRTGSLTFASTDLRVAGIGKPLLVARTYNSADTTGGLFGPGWSSLFDVGVTMNANKTLATVRGEDGQQTVWTWSGKNAGFVAPSGARGKLDCGGNTGNHCRYTRVDGSYWDVNYTAPGGGQLQTYKDADGYGLTFAWATNHVTITVTSTTTTPYQVVGTIANGHITHLATPAGRTVDYTYDGSGHLTSVTDTANRTWSYTYGAAGRLTHQTDPDANDRLVATYDGSGHVVHVSAKGSSRHTDDDFAYDSTTGLTTRTVHEAVNGTATTSDYTYKYLNNSLISETTPSGACTRYSYDSKGNLVLTVDPLGWATTLGYDSANDLTSETTPLSTVSMTYDSSHRILSRKDAGGATTSYAYGGPYLQTIVQPGGAKTTLSYNNRGLLTLVTGPQGKQSFGYDAFGNRNSSHLLTLGGAALDGPGTSSTYDEAGRQLTSTDADGRTTTTAYDAAGDKLSMTNADGQVTTYQYTGAADLKKVVTATHTTEYAWDEGSKTETTTTDGSASSQAFDASGHLLQEKVGNTTTKTDDYDASGRLVQQTDASGITTRYTYDANSNPVLVTSSAGDVMSRQYDALNHPIRQVLDGAVTRTTYDASGNILTKTDPSGHVTSYTYTPANEVKTVTTSAGVTTYSYDLDGNVTSLTDPRGHRTTTYAYDAANRRTSTTVAGNTTTFGYDNASNIVSETDPDGRRTSYTLDALNRPVKTTYSWNGSSFDVAQQYDADGRRVQMVDPTGTHDYTYDAAGNLTSVTYKGDTFTYDYSTAGKIVETYPDGTHVTFGVDDANNVMSVDSGTQGQPDYLHVAYLRNAQRFTIGIASSNGVLETRQLDQAGHVLDQQLSVGGSPVADDSFSYDAAGERLQQVDNVGGNVTTNKYAYDGAGRLTGFSSDTATTNALDWPTNALSSDVPTGTGAGVTPPIPASLPVKPQPALNPAPPTAYGYDANGNRAGGGGNSSSFDAADELTSTSVGGQRSMTYDKSGDLTSVTGTSGTETFTYDAAKRLVGVHLPSGKDISYTYDGDGLRVSKTVDNHRTDFVWDPASATPQLVMERTGAGDLIRRYFYGDGPVAMQTPSATFFFHLDPQGTVQELTDSAGNLAAAYHYDGFGALQSVSGPTPRPENPILFQAGYLDADTGLYNMGARNYDASLGRFTQRDPLERPTDAGFVSSYVFVDDRPTLFIDPTGQFEAQDVFWSHNTVEANVAMLGSYALSAAKVTYAAGKQVVAFAEDPSAYLEAKWASLQELGTTIKGKITELGDYLSEKLSSAATSAEEEIVGNIGEAAGAESEAAVEVLERSGGEIAELGAEAGEVAGESAEVLAESGEAAKFGGIALAVVGIGLQTFITVEDCMHDTVTKCVADTVGLAVAVGFIVGCEAASLGSLTPLCGLAGAAISVGLTEIINRYGPQIAAGFVAGYDATVAGLTTAGEWIADTGTMVGDQIVTGYNTAITALKSGFDDAINTLVNAGYSAEQLALSLVNSFNVGLDAAVNALVGFGYDVADIATAIYNDFTHDVGVAVQALKDAYAFTVTAISDAVVSAFNATAEVLGQALKDAQYAVDQVAAGLKSAYNAVADWTDAAVADVLKGLNYGVNAIAGALQDVYNDADQAVATVLKGLNYAVDQVAGALSSFYNDLDHAAAVALNFAGYTFNEIATGLKDIYKDAAALTASILKGIDDAVNQIAGALQSVYDLAAEGTAQILKGLEYGATAVAGALEDAYNAIVTNIDAVVTGALYDVGYVVNDVVDAITATFTDIASDAQQVADLLYNAGYALVDVGDGIVHAFASADQVLVKILDNVSGSLDDAANAIAVVYNEGVQAVAQALKDALYSIDDIANVLQTGFHYLADAAAAVLQGIGASVEDMVHELDSVWHTAQSQIVSILNGLSVDLTQLKDAFVSLFGSTVQEIEDIFSAGGVLASAIQTLGDAFSSFGDAVVSGVEDAWDTFTSWF